MTGITAAGTGSGIDIESLVTSLMTAEKAPLTKLSAKEATIQSKISMIGQFKSLVSGLQTSAVNLQNLGKLNGIKTSIGDASIATITATNKATLGSYSMDVLSLAKAQQIVTKTAADGGFTSVDDLMVEGSATSGVTTAKISINFDSVSGGTFTNTDNLKELSIDVGTDGITLQDVADAINAGDYGVQASLIKDKNNSVRLSLSGTATGAENAFKIDVSYWDGSDPAAEVTPATTQKLSSLAFDPTSADTGLFDDTTIVSALDSQIKLNGVSITRASNSIDDVIDGVTINLKATTSSDGGVTSTPTTLTISRDSSTISTQMQAFVDAYNQIASAIKSTASYDATTKVAGTLQGDATIRSLQNQLRSLMSGTFGDGSNTSTTLNSLGVSFQKDGTLKLDTVKLGTAVSTDLNGVIEFLGAFDQTSSTVAPTASKDGFAYKLEQLTKGILADNGLINSKLDGLNRSVDDIGDQRTRISLRLTQIEKRYRAQFTAMDTAVANMQNLSTYVTQLLNTTSSSSS